MTLTEELRLLSGFHWGTDIAERVESAIAWQKQQGAALARAADEIERLTKLLEERQAPTAA
jgi:hypothetical protein